MQIVETIAAARLACRSLRASRGELGLVPTMGALHQGHLSLIRAAMQDCGAVAVSLFVNPKQFGPNEDFSRYPRTFDQDCALLRSAGVSLLFAPQVEEMYPPGESTIVEVEQLSGRLDGASRPGHFRGVATVVAKLFHIVAPHRAYFGQKDGVQVAVLRKMVRDLNFDLDLVVCPTVRDPDGLAVSSRNRYLTEPQRRQALALSRALRAAEERVAAGERAVPKLLASARRVLAEAEEVRLDYLALVDPDTLEEVTELHRPAMLAVAAHVGATRLIDNVLLHP